MGWLTNRSNWVVNFDAYVWHIVFLDIWYYELVNWSLVGLSHLTLSRLRALRAFTYLPHFMLIVAAGTL